MNLRRLWIVLVLIGGLISCSRPAVTPPQADATLAPTPSPVPTPTATPIPPPTLWWRDSIVYEIFPYSFYDSNGDGVGDLRGVAAKLDYIQSLGANTLWLTSVFSSTSTIEPEVMDWYTLMPSLGAKDDLAELVRQAHNRKLRVIMDLNVVYTSNESAQFKDAYNKPASQYSDWYQWTNTAHTAYKSFANARTKPLLNHANASAQAYLVQVARDWLDVGVDGFRLNDAAGAPHEFWKAFRRAIKQTHQNAWLLGEVWESDAAKLVPYFQDEFDSLLDVPTYYALAGRPDRNGAGVLNGASLPSVLDAALVATQSITPTSQFVRLIGMHNTNRIASIVGLASRAAQERIAAALVLTLPGTPMIYYGDEIGMEGYLGMGALGDDYRRAPMDWFKSGKGTGLPTWFKEANRVIKPNDGVSVEEQQTVPGSLWSVYQTLASQRAKHPALSRGNWQSLTSTCRACYAYARWDENDLYLIALNLSGQTQSVSLDLSIVPRLVSGAGQDLLQGGQVSLPSSGRYTITLNAWDARVILWEK